MDLEQISLIALLVIVGIVSIVLQIKTWKIEGDFYRHCADPTARMTLDEDDEDEGQ
jgi:hypothetical protein